MRRVPTGAIELAGRNQNRFMDIAVVKILAIEIWGSPTESVRAFDGLPVDRVTGLGEQNEWRARWRFDVEMGRGAREECGGVR